MARPIKGRLFRRGKSKNYYLQFYVNGKEIKRVLRDDNGNTITGKREAQKAADKLLAPYLAKDELQRREQVADALKTAKEKAVEIEKKQNRLEMKDVWQAYLDAPQDDKPNSGAGTLKNYERHWNNFVSWLKINHSSIKYFSDDITEKIAKGYSTFLRNSGIADSTFNYKLTALKLVTRVLMKRHGLRENVWDCVKRINSPKQDNKEEFTFEEAVQVLKYFDEPFHLMHKEQMRVVFAIGVYSGLRLADCVSLKWKNIISFENGLAIKCIPQKTQRLNKEIIAPIVKPLQNILTEARTWKDKSPYICPDVVERYERNPSGVRKDLIKVFAHAGYTVSKERSNKNITTSKGKFQKVRKASAYGFHSLRHALFSHLASHGVTIEKLSSWSGDSQKTLLQYYLHADSNRLIAEAQKIMQKNPIDVKAKVESKALPELEPEREQLIKFAKDLPIETVRNIISKFK